MVQVTHHADPNGCLRLYWKKKNNNNVNAPHLEVTCSKTPHGTICLFARAKDLFMKRKYRDAHECVQFYLRESGLH